MQEFDNDRITDDSPPCKDLTIAAGCLFGKAATSLLARRQSRLLHP